ncbi:MAG: response regulator [Chloroflexi bacterium]|nr:response regulator [Chloroflexota bacterium]
MLKVMLAEDDHTMVSLLKTLLRMDGFEVIALDADDDVPAAVARVCPDVLLMDVHISNQNGLEILDVIRSSNDICDVHVIMISGLNLKDECLRHGANDFLLKPFMPDDLIKLLKKAKTS